MRYLLLRRSVKSALLPAEVQLRAIMLEAGFRITLVFKGKLVEVVGLALVHRVHPLEKICLMDRRLFKEVLQLLLRFILDRLLDVHLSLHRRRDLGLRVVPGA